MVMPALLLSVSLPNRAGPPTHSGPEVRGMQLLVSVGSAVEALAALAGGADLIDAKDARAGRARPGVG